MRGSVEWICEKWLIQFGALLSKHKFESSFTRKKFEENIAPNKN